MQNTRKILVYSLLIFVSLFFYSCKSGSDISISENEYKENKREGFWVIRNKKAMRYNAKVAKPKLDRQTRKLARENKQIEKYNGKQRLRYQNNNTHLKSHGHNLKTYDHH